MGQSSPIPAPPWFYSGDVLTMEYRTDAALAAGLLPDSNSPPPRTLARWRSSGPTGCPAPRTRSTPSTLYCGQYKETFVVVRCSPKAGLSAGASTFGWTATKVARMLSR